jgi:hypothetical protein
LKCRIAELALIESSQTLKITRNRQTKKEPALKNKILFRLCFSLLLFVFSLPAPGQSYSIDWSTIDGGGGTSTGGVYSVVGTIGQPDASVQPMTGGNYSLIGGFWSVIAIATPGAPNLKIVFTTTNTVVVSWPSPSVGFTLQQNLDLNTANWIGAPQTVNDNGTDKFIIVNPPAGNRFYRLFKP